VPFTTKLTECENVVKSTMNVLNEDGTTTFRQNTPVRFLLFHMTMIKWYTDVEIEDIVKDYDTLDESGAFDTLVSKLPMHEFKEFSTILSMAVDDYISNNRTVLSAIDNMMTTLLTVKGIEKNG